MISDQCSAVQCSESACLMCEKRVQPRAEAGALWRSGVEDQSG